MIYTFNSGISNNLENSKSFLFNKDFHSNSFSYFKFLRSFTFFINDENFNSISGLINEVTLIHANPVPLVTSLRF